MIDLILNLIRKKAALYLEMMHQGALSAAYPHILDEEASSQDIEELQAEIVLRVKDDLLSGRQNRYEKIVRDFNPVAETVMELALAQYIYPDWKEVWENIGDSYLTIENAARICYCDNDPVIHAYSTMEEAYEQLKNLFYFERGDQTEYIRKNITMDERLYAYLQGSDQTKKEYASIGKRVDVSSEPKKQYIRLKEKESLVSYIENDNTDSEYHLIHIQGNEKNGKRFLAEQAERELGKSIIFIDYEALKAQDIHTARRLVWYFYRECYFYQAIPCFYGLNERNCGKREDVEAFLLVCIYTYGAKVPRIYICSDEGVDVASILPITVYKLELGAPDRNERIILWKSFAEEAGLKTPLDTAIISTKYKLSVGQIRLAVEYLRQRELGGEAIDDNQIGQICNRILPPPSQGSIKRVYTQLTIDDLKLQPTQKQILYNICNHIWHRHKVFDTWNMQSKYSYGTGVSCLFAGPPGTGKTMAAQIMSTMLELPLYRVDLSQVVDKYIGETEKKLEAIFNLAEKSNTILFFDEADSIFGKRSEVNDAKDKYANTEVSYILQRIDEYDGIVILATNFRNNIDEAFMRRIRYVVEFMMPDVEMRQEIWRGCFPKEVPAEDIDFKYLANHFELSGGNIKNIVLNAVFLAASEDVPVNMRHILESLRMEKLKMGKVMIPGDFAEYGYYFET